jgi:hypothetical protein
MAVSMTLRLKACDIDACEARCCHDGVYLSASEETRLKRLVERTPELRARPPGRCPACARSARTG